MTKSESPPRWFAARLARRILLAGKVRTAFALGVTVVMVGLVVAGSVLLTGLTDTPAQQVEQATGGAPIAINIAGNPGAIKNALNQLPKSADADVVILSNSMPIRNGERVEVVPYLEQSWSRDQGSFKLIAGAFPEKANTIAVSDVLARSLSIAVGDSVELGYDRGQARRVVGVVQNSLSLSYQQVLGGSGTRWLIRSPGTIRPFISDSATLKVWGVDPTPAMLGRLSSIGQTQIASDLAEPQPLFVRQPLLVGVPILLLVGGAVAAVLVARLRRLRRDLAVFIALGVPSKHIDRAVVLSNFGLVGVGAVLGAVGGWMLANGLRTSVVRWADRDIELRMISPTLVVILLCSVAAATTAVTIFTLRRTRRDDEVGVGTRPALELPVPRYSRGSVVRRGVQVLAGIGTLLLMKTAPSDVIGFSLLAATATTLGIATIPDLFQGIQILTLRSSPTVRFAARMVNRELFRGAAIAAVALTALLSPLTISATTASLDGYNRTVIRWNPLPGQLAIRAPSPLPASVTSAIGAAAAAPVVARYAAEGRLADAEQDRNVLVVESAEDLTAISNYEPTAAERAALQSGAVLVFDVTAARGSTATFAADTGGLSRRLKAVPASGTWRGDHGQTGGAVMIKSVAERDGIKVSVDGYRVLGGQDRIDDVRRVATQQGLLPTQISVDPGPPVSTSKQLPLAAIGGVILAFLLSVGMAMLGMREWQPALRQLSALGVSGRSIMVAGSLLTALPAAVGATFGVLGGMLTATVRIAASHVRLLTPWGEYLLAAGGLVAVLAVVGAAFGWRTSATESTGRDTDG